MNVSRKPVVLVGVSGSTASRDALRWAADEASRRQAGLWVVRAFEQPVAASYAHPPGTGGPHRTEELARRDLAAAMRAVLGPGPRPDTTSEVVEGIAERVLVDRSASADLLVLGSGSATAGGRPIGPVVRTCLNRALCPVVTVRPGTPNLPAPPAPDPTVSDDVLLTVGLAPASRSTD